MRPGMERMSGMRANETRSGSVTALLVTAIGNALLSYDDPREWARIEGVSPGHPFPGIPTTKQKKKKINAT